LFDGVGFRRFAPAAADVLDFPAVAFAGSFLLPCLGFLFLPFTTLVYVWLVQGVGAIQGIDWLWLVLAVVVDVFNTAGAGYANRNRMPGYTAPTPPPAAPPPSQPAS
jgi:hypothetical protein